MIRENTPAPRFQVPVLLPHQNWVLFALWLAQQLAFVWALFWVWSHWVPGNPAVPLIVVAWTFTFAPGLCVPVIRLLPARWCQVPARERVLHETLGVGIFERLLEASGHNRRNIYPFWGGPIKARLPFRALMARGAGGAHAICFAVHLLLAAAALFTGHPWCALGILLPGIIVHLYPVLLQRSIMLRLQPLLARYCPAWSAGL